MNNVNLVEIELKYYIDSAGTIGGLLLSGQWGSGKSHVIKEFISKNNELVSFGYISIFGVDSSDELHKRIKESYISNYLGITETNNKKIKKGWRITKTISDSISELPISLPVISSVTDCISSTITYDYLSLIDVKNTVKIKSEEGSKEIPFVLVIDDFERCTMPIIDRIGVLNNYIENKQIKTIILADENKVKDSAYSEFKEKVISQTVYLIQDEKSTIESIINKYSTKDDEYITFLKNYSGLFEEAFTDSGYCNYRSFLICVTLFERIFHTSYEIFGAETDRLSGFIYEFCARVYECRASTLKMFDFDSWTLGNYDDNTITTSIVKKYKRSFAFRNNFKSIYKWLLVGVWDESHFIDELKQYLYPKTEDKLIWGPALSISQEDIDIGLKTVLGKAYAGELSRNELISFVCLLKFIQESDFTLPCSIHYESLGSGFIKRMENNIYGGITETRITPIPTAIHVDKACISLIDKLNASNKKIEAQINRRDFIMFLNTEISDDGSHLWYKHYDEFDNEMLTVFKKKYFTASELTLTTLETLLSNCIFYDTDYSSITNIDSTIKHLEKLRINLVNRTATSFQDSRINHMRSLISIIDSMKEKLNETLNSSKNTVPSIQ